MHIIDTHTHLDHLENLDECLKAADAAGVEAIVTVGVDWAANKKNLEIKKKTSRPRIYTALGIHPGNINMDEVPGCIQWIRENIKEAVAIGETGLDYWYKWVKKDDAKKAEQRNVFEMQLVLGQEFDLPVIAHSRGAWADCLSMMKAAKIKRGLFHWYSGPVDILNQILEAGYYVSASPSLAYSPQSREAIQHAPIERTLIETDSPVHYKISETEDFWAQPKDVFRTLDAYSRLKNVDAQVAVEKLNSNAREFFRLK